MSKARMASRFPIRRALAAAAAGAVVLAARPGVAAVACGDGPGGAAVANAASLDMAPLAVFGRPETGWAIYAPLIASEIGTACPADSPAFAARLAAWRTRHGLPGGGAMDAATLGRFKALWQSRRPFAAASRIACPAAPAETALARAGPRETWGARVILLRPGALAAWRAMVAAARDDSPALAGDRRLLTIFSAFRSPAYDDARCALQHDCQGVTRAACSAHRTGLAVDLYLGAAPGFAPDSADDANRRFLSRSTAYLWLVRNAARFGFVNYAFEPWHWEWTGEPP